MGKKNVNLIKYIIPLIFFTMSLSYSQNKVTSRLLVKPTESGTLVSLADKTSQQIRVGVVNELNVSSPSMIYLEGRVPVMLVPLGSDGTSDVVLNPPTIKEATALQGQKEMSLVISELYLGINDVQKEIQKKNLERALIKVEDMIKKYPDVYFLHFTLGSVLFLQGKKDLARKAVVKALEGHPQFQEGREFLKAIGGTEERTPASEEKKAPANE